MSSTIVDACAEELPLQGAVRRSALTGDGRYRARGRRRNGRRCPAVVVAAATGALLLAGCGSSAPTGQVTYPPHATPAVSAPRSSAHPTPGSTSGRAVRPAISKVLTIVEENHSLAEMRAGMPYLYGMARQYGYATDYRAVAHPSLPNYLAIAGGSTFGIRDDGSPVTHPLSGPSVFGQALAAGRTARLYAESMPSPCDTVPAGPYAVKHAPWAYFLDERAACRAGMVPSGTPGSGALAADIAAGRLPTVGMLIPNLDHDAHDGTLSAADQWLRQWLSPLLHGPDFTSGRLAVVVTADEDDSSSGNRVLTVLLAPGVAHQVVTTPLTHYSLTRFYDDVAGAPALRAATSAESLGAAFGLRAAG